MNKETWTQIRSELKRSHAALPTLLVLLADCFLVSGSYYLASTRSLLGWFGSQVMLLLALTHLYVIHHELVHGSVFQTKRGNELAGHLVCFLIGLPFLPRRSSHLHHHTWAGNINDPANQRLITRLSTCSASTLKRFDFLWSISFPFLVLNERMGLWLKPFMDHRRGVQTREAKKEYQFQVVYLCGYAILFLLVLRTGAIGFYLSWVLPAWCVSLLVEEMANLPHHLDAPLFDSPEPVPLWEQTAITHSCQTIPFWSRWILLSFNLHTVHHLFPWVPWYDLRRAQALMRRYSPELGEENTDEFSWLFKRRTTSFTQAFHAYIRKPATLK